MTVMNFLFLFFFLFVEVVAYRNLAIQLIYGGFFLKYFGFTGCPFAEFGHSLFQQIFKFHSSKGKKKKIFGGHIAS